MKYKRGDLLLVTWSDIVSESGWTEKEELELAKCVSVGFFTMLKDKNLYLHASFSDDAIGDRIVIPKSVIKSTKILDASRELSQTKGLPKGKEK